MRMSELRCIVIAMAFPLTKFLVDSRMVEFYGLEQFNIYSPEYADPCKVKLRTLTKFSPPSHANPKLSLLCFK